MSVHPIQPTIELPATNQEVPRIHENTGLHRAIVAGELTKINQLIADGANIHLLDSGGQTYLHLAAQHGKFEIVKLLIVCGVDVHKLDNNMNTVLHHMLKHLFTNDNFPIMYAVIQLLIVCGINLNAKNIYGITCLFLPSSYSYTTPYYLNIIKLLIDNGADINIKNAQGCSIVCDIIRINSNVIIQLMESGVHIDIFDFTCRTPLMHIMNRHLTPIDMLIRIIELTPNINVKDVYGKTALHYAIELNKIDTIQHLITHGADINITNWDGQDALTMAYVLNKPTIARILIDNGADVISARKHYLAYRRASTIRNIIPSKSQVIDQAYFIGYVILHFRLPHGYTWAWR